ncbi:MAG TPA: restriction endonuclease [Candidatus Limnocylindria bacterium]|jgi:restriction system protein|nr:restriction endonuclease [Candidatus Limnocylindria bacterium]
MAVPKYDDLFQPLLNAMHQLGGSASVTEQEDTVAALLKLTEKDISEIHNGTRTVFSYRLAWARHYLKHFGLIENSARGVWLLTPKGSNQASIDKESVKRVVKAMRNTSNNVAEDTSDELEKEKPRWQDSLLETIRSIPPAAFERLCQRLLRESGFIHVEVTGHPGDGGIDGRGVVRIGGLLSFHVKFQCKRYKGSVGPSTVRDFRGAMDGRADKGLLITTGRFTRDARTEAQRDGAKPIDLVDGDELVEKLKQLRIGVDVQQVEHVIIREDYFKSV